MADMAWNEIKSNQTISNSFDKIHLFVEWYTYL